jgi:hypothetical protein
LPVRRNVAPATTCGVLHPDMPGLTVNVLGETGGALGDLVCQIVASPGDPAQLVTLLNQLLVLLAGALPG